MPIKKAIRWVLFWGALSLCFNALIWVFMGPDKALQYLGGDVIEQSLSMDNLFLFIMVFASFGIPPHYQRRVLNFGIAGAMILRLIFVVAGVNIINRFHWILYIFGVILIVSAVKMMIKEDETKDFSKSKVLRFVGKLFPMTPTLHGEKFFVRLKGILYATPLLAILVIIEFTDILFAIDSIPAIFSITTDPFIVYSSNIFAILGLRSLFFVLGNLQEKFQYVKYGIALILAFTGVKLSILYFNIVIPIGLSLLFIFAVLIISIFASVLASDRKKTA
ncbi:MAG: TerC/Alx family metal homeostasis membrane protein [Clostridia bacterium]|nr:TerC/Alx family metal homeostasis membrane protein [Clostridia bacterium]